MAAQYECTGDHQTVPLNTAKMVSFMLYVFHHNKNF